MESVGGTTLESMVSTTGQSIPVEPERQESLDHLETCSVAA
jgi:hypothetical protein